MSESEIGFKIGTNVQFVVENSLCHGCGTCEAVCPVDAIEMYYEDRRGIYLPDIDQSSCDNCTVCVQACSGFELDLTEKPESQNGLSEHPLIGSHDAIYRSFTNDTVRRSRASSGGLITELIDHLISSGRVDKAIVTRMSKENPLKAEAYIAESASQLIASQKSKYCPVPLNRILKSLIREGSNEKYVFVGLPHHVHGLRLIQRIFPHMRDCISYVISSFTAHVPSQRATEFILFKNAIRPDDVRAIEYRGGGNPGRMRIQTKQDKEYFVPHLHWTYSGHTFPLFFYPVREWLYFDKMSEWADFTMGDNWMNGIEEQKGASTVIVRSKAAHAIFGELVDQQKVVATAMTTDDLIADQVLHTKLNVYWRLKIWAWLGRKTPVYSRTFEKLRHQRFKTFRFSMYVLLCEHMVPFSIMDKIIKADYYCRARPKMFFKKSARRVRLGLRVFTLTKQPVLEKKSKYKIVLIGGYGCDDIGDEAMPHAIRIGLRERLGSDLEIMMLSPFPNRTIEKHGEDSNYDFTQISHGLGASAARKFVTFGMTLILYSAVFIEKHSKLRLALWRSTRAALDEIQSADLIMNVGGGNINSVIPSELYRKTTTYNIADMLEKPVFISGQTMGPFYGWFAKTYTRRALNKVNMISFRDKKVSHDRLKEIGVNKPVMFDAADDAISLAGVNEEEAKRLLSGETGVSVEALKEKLLVVLNLKASLSVFKGKGRSTGLDREIDLMAKIADALIEKYDCKVVLMPTDFSDTVDDRVVHQKIYDRISRQSSVFQVSGIYSDDELIGMIALADVAIGARYHFNVFAASRHIAFLGLASGIYQRTKLQGLAALCGMNECYVDHDMEYVDMSDVWPAVVNVVENRHEIRSNLAQRVPQLKKNSMRVVDEAVSYLTSNQKQV